MKSSGFREYCPPSSLSEGGGLWEGKNGEGNWGSCIFQEKLNWFSFTGDHSAYIS